MFGKKQKGFTLIELIMSVWFVIIAGFVLFLMGTAVWAAGKYLFGWW